ncbi:hypothetical protein JL721_6083 [Aureococcus anophagefferens]|nr:hypothetical protein JL721_6083 [Aureococcus anophagefferens]
MMPEGELPGGLDVICEGVVPVDGPDGPRQVMAVRRGARKLLCDLHAAGAVVRVVTANLIGVEAIAALAASEADGAEPRSASVGRRRATPRPHRARFASPQLRAGNGSKCVILDDNPTAWEAYAARYVWVVPQYDADRPRANSQNGPTPRGGPARPRSTSLDDAAAAPRPRASSFDEKERKPNVIRTFSESRPQLSRRAEPARNLQPIRSFDAMPRRRSDLRRRQVAQSGRAGAAAAGLGARAGAAGAAAEEAPPPKKAPPKRKKRADDWDSDDDRTTRPAGRARRPRPRPRATT